MTFSLNFEKNAISTLELDYVKVQIRPEQLKIINELSNLFSRELEIPVLALRGMIWNALKEWQIKNNKPTSEIVNMENAQKIIAVKQIFNLGKVCMKSLLCPPKEEGEALVDIIYEKTFKYYIDYLNRIN
jgi:hypothetical protein